jgi:hypothetical protein
LIFRLGLKHLEKDRSLAPLDSSYRLPANLEKDRSLAPLGSSYRLPANLEKDRSLAPLGSSYGLTASDSFAHRLLFILGEHFDIRAD